MQAAPDMVLKALADPTRRALFESLMRHGEQTVRVLTDHARVSQPAVSKHLGVLRAVGLVRDRPDGRLIHYRAEPKALAPLVNWMSTYSAFWNERFDRLENLLKRL